MPHRLKAIITTQEINKEKADEIGFRYFFEDQAYIIPLSSSHLEAWSQKLESKDSFHPLDSFDKNLTHKLMKEIGLTHYAYVQTEYYAGEGTQRATVYENNEVKAFFIPINAALRMLGVKKKKDMDEFDTINLREYRNAERFY